MEEPNLPPQGSTRPAKTLIAVGVLIILVGAYFYFKPLPKPASQNQTASNKQSTSTQPTVTNISATKFPPNLPPNLPLEEHASVIHNYTTTNANGDFVAERDFISSNTVAQEITAFKNFFAKNGWTVTQATTADPNNQILKATSGKNILTIGVYKGSDGKTVVYINFVMGK